METRFQEALKRFDAANAEDPNRIVIDGTEQPYELAYSKWLTEWVLRLNPEASEALRLAARCQHLCRWEIPRSSYEMDRTGYLKWRTELKKLHAAKSAEILSAVGYPPEVVQKVQDLNLKKNLGGDPECQVLEDALCLVTLQHQLTDLMRKTDPEKMVTILQKTWKKMSPQGHEAALKLSYSDQEKALLQRALA
jgi:hypothetical protein